LIMAVSALLLVMTAGVALAATIIGTNESETLVDTAFRD
jgi:hypothetical protein